ncbi:MAG: SMC-Scp complex subunit ScpB [Parcubacteria group bacterium]
MLKTKIESLLFISHKPLSVKSLVNFLKKESETVKPEEATQILEELKAKYNFQESGVQIIQTGDEYQMVTNPDAGALVKKFINEDMTGELTPASLEALTVIAYRGPISKAELEQIRGVNCSLILRNLLIRGLIKMDEDKTKMNFFYSATVDFLKYLGINSVNELPDYQTLHQTETLNQFLEKQGT